MALFRRTVVVLDARTKVLGILCLTSEGREKIAEDAVYNLRVRARILRGVSIV